MTAVALLDTTYAASSTLIDSTADMVVHVYWYITVTKQQVTFNNKTQLRPYKM